MVLSEQLKELLDNGVHFGHLSKHWNPKMKRFIFGKKKDVYVIDLEKTVIQLELAKEFVSKLAQNGEKILFVATKRQIREVVRELAISCKMPYCGDRWVGGFLTNFSTIRTRVKKYINLLESKESGDFDRFSRKEVVRVKRDLERMEKNYSGVKDMNGLPGCIFVVDPKREDACVREAAKLKIPIVAVIDTDSDPDNINYPIPANDDAIKSVRCIVQSIAEAIKDGERKGVEMFKAKQEQEKKDAKAKLEAQNKGPIADQYDEIEEEIKEKDEKEVLKKRATEL